jgi:hypothetical protein
LTTYYTNLTYPNTNITLRNARRFAGDVSTASGIPAIRGACVTLTNSNLNP